MLAWLALTSIAQDPGSAGVKRFALLVGHNDGGTGRPILRYAHDDAEQMGNVLSDLGGVSPDQAWYLYDPDAAMLEDAFSVIQSKLAVTNGRTEFVFYYSGHSDEEGLLLGDERLGYRALRDRLEGLPAQVRIAILDSCASGALILAKGGRRVAPFLADESTEVGGFAYITSSSADEVAQEAERIGGSYFTHYLASGLRGAADLSGDGRVSLTEAYTFANAETLAHTERSQHGPQHATYDIQLSGRGDLVLTDLGLTTATLVLDAGLDGRVALRNSDGGLVAELQKAPGRATVLGLGEGRYGVTMTRTGENRYGQASVLLSAGSSTLLKAEQVTWHASELAVARGGASIPEEAQLSEPTDSALGRSASNLMRLELVPGVPPSKPGIDRLLVGLVGAQTAELRGIGAALVSVDVAGKANGIVTSLAVTRVGDLSGLQAGLVANVSQDGGIGGQSSVAFNLATGGFDGVQSSMGLNIATRGVRGAQLTTGVNEAQGGIRGAQIGSVNLAGGWSEGTQIGFVNVVKGMEGAQISLLNIGTDVRGMQLGIINVARDVSGTQIGLVNIARDVKGTPLGLLSFEKEGRHNLLVYASETELANLEIRFGGNTLYTVVGAGGLTRNAYAHFGLGAHLPFNRIWLDTDAVFGAYAPLGPTVLGGDPSAGTFSQPPTSVVRLRATLGVEVVPGFAPFAGLSFNGQLPASTPTIQVAPEWFHKGQGNLVGWPGVFLGAQF